MDVLAALILMLGADSFDARQAASAALRAIDDPVMLARIRSNDPEVRHRVADLLDDALSVWPSDGGPLPWCDMLPVWMEPRLAPSGSGGLPLWIEYRAETGHLVAELRRAGWERWRVQRLLDGMCLVEAQYCRRTGYVGGR